MSQQEVEGIVVQRIAQGEPFNKSFKLEFEANSWEKI